MSKEKLRDNVTQFNQKLINQSIIAATNPHELLIYSPNTIVSPIDYLINSPIYS